MKRIEVKRLPKQRIRRSKHHLIRLKRHLAAPKAKIMFSAPPRTESTTTTTTAQCGFTATTTAAQTFHAFCTPIDDDTNTMPNYD
jgi:hypothetical protein